MRTNEEAGVAFKQAAKLYTSRKYEAAAEIYESLASAGYPRAQVMLGWMLEVGVGLQPDLAGARRWYNAAADAGLSEGFFYLGALDLRDCRYEEAANSLDVAAAQGYAPALYLLGLMYELGDGVVVDRQKAYRLYEQAAARGHLWAKRAIAEAMISGRGGVMQRLKGMCLLLSTVATAFIVGLRDPDSDRLRGSHAFRWIN